MDLRNLLVICPEAAATTALRIYFQQIFQVLPPAPERARLRSALNFAVQQLATQSRVDPGHRRFLIAGDFLAHDLAAALIEAMPHTQVAWQPGPPDAEIESALADLRPRLTSDALPTDIRRAEALPLACCGLIALFDRDPAPYRPLLHPAGRMLLVRGLEPSIG